MGIVFEKVRFQSPSPRLLSLKELMSGPNTLTLPISERVLENHGLLMICVLG
jgi:hypothetical protein